MEGKNFENSSNELKQFCEKIKSYEPLALPNMASKLKLLTGDPKQRLTGLGLTEVEQYELLNIICDVFEVSIDNRELRFGTDTATVGDLYRLVQEKRLPQ